MDKIRSAYRGRVLPIMGGAFQAVPNTASFRCRYTGVLAGELEGLDAQYKLYVRNTVLGWSVAHLQATGDLIRDQHNANMRPLLSTAWGFDAVDGRDEGAEFGATSLSVGAGAGTRVGAAPPAGVALQVRFDGDTGAPPRKGWIFGPFGVEADLAGERWLDPLRVAAETAFETLRAAITAVLNGDAQVIVSRHSGTEPDPTAKRAVKRVTALTNTLTNVGVPPTYASQRNRRF